MYIGMPLRLVWDNETLHMVTAEYYTYDDRDNAHEKRPLMAVG